MLKDDVAQQLQNARRRLKRLEDWRENSPEAREAFQSGPLAQGAMGAVSEADEMIQKERDEITRLEAEREKRREKK